LRDTLRRAISYYKAGRLPSFFDSRVNLLLDLKKPGEEWKRQAAVDRMTRILHNYEDLLEECSRKPMKLSGFVMGIARVRCHKSSCFS
jgi:hypothetical protein